MALYNDERPKRFKEVLGQGVVVKQMKRKLAEGRFPQTVLATGPRGTGKTTCARIIAKALNCETPLEDGEPCCECASCKAIDKGISPSVIELDAATHNGVDDVRALVEQSKFSPVEKKMVFILDEVHMFSTAAWNALLKTLEEPPKDVIFILATTELQKVPVTVLSRCLRFEFQKISRETMSNYIYDLCKKYEIGIEPGALSLIVTQAEGCMRDALSLLEQFIGCEELSTETVLDFLGLASDDVIFDVLMGMCNGDSKAAIEVIEDCENRGKSVVSIVKSLLEALTYAAGYKAGGILPAQSEEYKSKLVAFTDRVTESKLNQITGTFLQIYPLLQKNVHLTFLLKAAIMNVVSSESLLCRLEAEVTMLKERPVAAAVAPVETEPVMAAALDSIDSMNTTETGRPIENKTIDSIQPMATTKKVVVFPMSQDTSTVEQSLDKQAQAAEFEAIPEFPDSEWENYSDSMSGLFENGESCVEEPNNFCNELNGSSFGEEHSEDAGANQGTGADVVSPVVPHSGSPVLMDGIAMSMDELMAAMEKGSLQSGATTAMTPSNIVEFKGAAGNAEDDKEDTPASVEEEVPKFEAFNFFLAGGSAWL